MGTRSADGSYDVIVVGLGGMGSAAAWHLARRGRRVLGLERFTVAHDQGSSHGGSRIIRLAYFEDPAYVPLLLRSYELWRQLERDGNCGLLLVTGGLFLGRLSSPTVAGALRSASEWGLAHQLLDAPELRRRFPTLAPGEDTVAFFEEVAGLVRPEATVAAQVRLAEAAGADCRFQEPVLSWEASADGASVTVRTAVDAYRADRLVICPGPYASTLLADLGIPIKVERQLQTWFQPEGGLGPFLPERHPIWLWEPDEKMEGVGLRGFVYGFPAIDGPDGGVKINVVVDPEGCTPETIHRRIRDAELETTTAQVRRRLAVGPGRLLRADTCMFENTPDGHFIVGHHPGHPQVTVAAGFSGHGFKFVPVMGEILADLALDGTTSHPIALFDPHRFKTEPVP